MAHQVLVVDDQERIREVLRGYLSAEGFDVLEAADAAETMRQLEAQHPTVVLLDVGLPDLDGVEVLRRLRTHSDAKIADAFVIMVTARTEEVDKLIGLAVGADAYVTKPFSPREVVARVKAILRRERHNQPEPSDVHRYAGITIDPGRREVFTGDTQVELSTLEFDLLSALAASPGRVYSRHQLLERVWGYDFYGDERVVDVHIRNLRKALGDDAAEPRFIRTVRGVGYKFVAAPQ